VKDLVYDKRDSNDQDAGSFAVTAKAELPEPLLPRTLDLAELIRGDV